MKVDLHIHSVYSSYALYKKDFPYYCYFLDSTMNIKDIFNVSKDRKLDAISITDHGTTKSLNYINKNIKSNVISIRGIELRTDIGEILIYGDIKDFPKYTGNDYYKVTDIAKEKSCLVIAPHPFLNNAYGYNGLFSLKNKIKNINFKNVASRLDGVCCYRYNLGIDKKAINLANKYKLVPVSTSDAHYLSQIGLAYTEIEKCKNEKEVINCIKSGEIINIFGKKVNKVNLTQEIIKSQIIDRFRKFDEFN